MCLDVVKGYFEYYQDMVEWIVCEILGVYFINQFGNLDNLCVYYEIIGLEIFEQMDGKVDVIVFGCGLFGIMIGLLCYFVEYLLQIELILVDLVGLIFIQYINEGVFLIKFGSWMVEGIGEDFLFGISDFLWVKKVYVIFDKESFLVGCDLLVKEGVLGGLFIGMLFVVVFMYCCEQMLFKWVVLFVCDIGNKYLFKMYNDYWMFDNGFFECEQYGDLCDLLLCLFVQCDIIVVGLNELLMIVYICMKLYDVLQFLVMDGQQLVGILDELDVLMYVYVDQLCFCEVVFIVMIIILQKIDVYLLIEVLLLVFDCGLVVIVMDGEWFMGLIMWIDLFNYLCWCVF